MAQTKRQSILNPARGSRARSRPRSNKRKQNRSRRHLTAKQIRYFGTPQQKAALKRKRRSQARAAKPARRHNRPAKMANRAKRAPSRARRSRQNPGEEILSLTLGNPAKRRSMARHAKKHNRRASSSGSSRKHNRRRKNPAVRHHRYTHRRHNPAFDITNLFTEGMGALAGLVGSRLLTQAVLGSNNVGAYGYAGNAAATAILATVAHMLFKGKPAVRDGVVIGGTVGILARAMQDYTPFGSYLASSGFGDYSGGGAHGLGVYLPWNGVTPQRYVDALAGAQVQIPSGWAPTVQVAAPAKVGMGGLYSGGMSLY